MRGERSLLAVGCALAAMLAGCGSGSSSPAHPAASTAAARTTATTATQPANAPQQLSPAQIRREFAANPYQEPGPPQAHPHANPAHVIVHDIKVGRGPPVRPGDTVWADYIEATYTSGREFLRAWGHQLTEYIALTSYRWMRGLIRGMTGMRAGGRRVIIVPRRYSDIQEPDRVGYSYREVVYWDVVLRFNQSARERQRAAR